MTTPPRGDGPDARTIAVRVFLIVIVIAVWALHQFVPEPDREAALRPTVATEQIGRR